MVYKGVPGEKLSSPPRIAVVGAGYWGPNLIRNFASMPGCRLHTVCDLSAARLASVSSKHPNVQTTTIFEDVLNDPEIDAVAVATPAESHRMLVEACLHAGKHVYVEKPLASNSRDAKSMVAVADKVGLTLMVGHLFLYDPVVLKMIELIRNGDIGEIRYSHSIRTSMAGTARLDTNIIWDALIHDAYILPALFGRPVKRVLAVGQGYLSPGIEDVAFVSLDFGDGALAHVYVSWYALEKARRMIAIGSTAVLAHDDLAEQRLTRFDRRYEQSEECDSQGRRRWLWHDGGAVAIDVVWEEPLRAECMHFVECVATGACPRTDARSGYDAVRVLEACQRSLDAGGAWAGVE